jgi:branched-chain amino acid transport system ATP-binding protein
MTVRENLLIGAYGNPGGDAGLRLAGVFDIFPRLEERLGQLAGTMSGGEQAMLSIGRGLMGAPKLLIIDEPSLGLSPLFVKENFSVIRRINESGVTILLVEQNVKQTLAIAHHGYVLSQGKVVAAGDAAVLRENAEVRAAYFGKN